MGFSQFLWLVALNNRLFDYQPKVQNRTFLLATC